MTANLNKHEPLVSIIIPCYNQAEYLGEAVESVVNQTYQNWEAIIVNDGSNDNTREVATGLINRYHNCKIFLYEKSNGGLASARNYGIRKSNGTLILPLDADDKIRPEMISKCVEVLKLYKNIYIAYTDVQQFGSVSGLVEAADYDFKKLIYDNQLNYCSLYKREVFEAIGGYNEKMLYQGYEDWEFWISAGEKGFYAKRIPQPFFCYRVRQGSMFMNAVQHDDELRSQIVLAHPYLYPPNKVLEAKKLLQTKLRKEIKTGPLVSVILPTYNRPEFLFAALESLSIQSYKNFEVIVINDAGVNVKRVLEKFHDCLKIKYYNHWRNKGLAAARNTGLHKAKGKYIAYLDDDDVFHYDHLESLVSFLESSNRKVAYTDAYRTCQIKDNTKYIVKNRELRYSQDFDYGQILVHNFIPIICLMHEKACLVEVGLFDESLVTHEDWDLLIRLSRKFEIHHIKNITCEFTWRIDGSSMLTERRAQILISFEKIYTKYKTHTENEPQIRKSQLKNIQVDFAGNFVEYKYYSIIYEAGFYEDEGGWRWMSEEGILTIRSKNDIEFDTLVAEVCCNISSSYSHFPFDIYVFSGNRLIGQIHFDKDEQRRQLFLHFPEKLKENQIRLISETSFTPSLIARNKDIRRLSVRLGNIHLLKTKIVNCEYLSGWYEEEQGTSGFYRWIGQKAEANIIFDNTSKAIRVEGFIPDINVFENHSIEVSLQLNGVTKISEVVARSGEFAIVYTMPELPTRDKTCLAISLDKVFIPAQLGLNDDKRKLGIMIKKIEFVNQLI